VQVPSISLRPFIEPTGINGTFCLTINKQNKIQSFERVSGWKCNIIVVFKCFYCEFCQLVRFVLAIDLKWCNDFVNSLHITRKVSYSAIVPENLRTWQTSLAYLKSLQLQWVLLRY
jgi:hypothetical protein